MKHLNLRQWDQLLRFYIAENGGQIWDIAMRCEASQLELGWKCGGFTINGKTFTAFAPFGDNGEPAMLAIRADVLPWCRKNYKRVATAGRAK